MARLTNSQLETGRILLVFCQATLGLMEALGVVLQQPQVVGVDQIRNAVNEGVECYRGLTTVSESFCAETVRCFEGTALVHGNSMECVVSV